MRVTLIIWFVCLGFSMSHTIDNNIELTPKRAFIIGIAAPVFFGAAVYDLVKESQVCRNHTMK